MIFATPDECMQLLTFAISIFFESYPAHFHKPEKVELPLYRLRVYLLNTKPSLVS